MFARFICPLSSFPFYFFIPHSSFKSHSAFDEPAWNPLFFLHLTSEEVSSCFRYAAVCRCTTSKTCDFFGSGLSLSESGLLSSLVKVVSAARLRLPFSSLALRYALHGRPGRSGSLRYIPTTSRLQYPPPLSLSVVLSRKVDCDVGWRVANLR